MNEFTNERAWQTFVTCSIVSNETKKLGGSVVLSAFKKRVKVVQVFEGDNFFCYVVNRCNQSEFRIQFVQHVTGNAYSEISCRSFNEE